MNCRDFERLWNELIEATSPRSSDAPASADAQRESALEEHAGNCPDCRRSAAGYEILNKAIAGWVTTPEPSPGLADRILAEVEATPRPRLPALRLSPSRVFSNRWLIASAASILAIGSLAFAISRFTIHGARDRSHLVENASVPNSRAGRTLPDGPRLNESLAIASEATWDLARFTSQPAARLSRQFLDAAGQGHSPRESDRSGAVSVPSLESFAPDSTSAVETLQQVGDHLASGVRPLSSSARQAFGFLFGSPAPKPGDHANPTAGKGA